MEANIDQAKKETAGLLWRKNGNFYRPDYTRGLNTVMPTVMELLGNPIPGFPTMTDHLPKATPRKVKRVVLLCLDALGFKEFAAGSLFPRLYCDYGTWVSSVFPTITSCALTSLAQGLPPSQHGLIGHEVWKHTPGAVVDLLKMQVVGATASLSESGFDLNQWRKSPGVLETDQSQRLPGTHLLPYRIQGSGLSLYTYNHGQRLGYVDFNEGLDKVARILNDIEHGWVSVYYEVIDSLSHVLGGGHPVVGIAVQQIEAVTQWLAKALPSHIAEETLLMVVADHGQNDIRQYLPIHGQPMNWLNQNTRAIGFSGRVMHLYLGDHPAAPVEEWLREFLGEAGQVLAFNEIAELAGDFTDPAFVRESLGDLVVVLHDGWNWEKRVRDPAASPYESRLVSQHGALSWEEMFVPLLAVPMSVLRSEPPA